MAGRIHISLKRSDGKPSNSLAAVMIALKLNGFKMRDWCVEMVGGSEYVNTDTLYAGSDECGALDRVARSLGLCSFENPEVRRLAA